MLVVIKHNILSVSSRTDRSHQGSKWLLLSLVSGAKKVISYGTHLQSTKVTKPKNIDNYTFIHSLPLVNPYDLKTTDIYIYIKSTRNTSTTFMPA